ncbi:hypothetical protein K4K61_003382 [Colletotrichum sp. SAR11_59]|nr:hypothetical protein K4K61_003382 [Colletotrichum sp. SAR11_59]
MDFATPDGAPYARSPPSAQNLSISPSLTPSTASVIPTQPDFAMIPNPPQGGVNGEPAESIDAFTTHLNDFARANGFAIVRRSGSNPSDGKATRYDLLSDRSAITGTTDIGSLCNCAFGLVSTDRKEGYDFLIKSFNEIHTEVGAREPSVAITDFEDALRASIMEALPATQLQLCIFHINANVDKYVRRRWQGDGGAPADEYDVNPDKEAAEAEVAAAAKAAQEAREAEAAILNDPQAQALNEVVRANRVLSMRQLDALVVDHTPTGFTELRVYVMYADTEDFNAAWARLQEEFADREPTLDYLRSTYFPLRHQWAQCFISEYENYGVRTNSPTETAHKDLKSYVITGHSDLLGVSQAIDEMLRNKERTYCRGRFTHQFKLPCSHKILELEKDGEKLTIYDVNPRLEL